MNLNNTKSLEDQLKPLMMANCNADHFAVYHEALTADLAIAINYTVHIPYRDISEPNNVKFVQQALSEIQDKIINSELVKNELNKKDIQIEIIKQDLERLNKEVEDLKRYKIFYDLYKDLRDGV